jgi:hypothetical protein
MAVEGSLDLFSLPEILQMISQQGKTGILTIQGQQDIVAISFLGGRIVAADSLAHTVEERLGKVLVGEGLLGAPELARANAENQAAGGRLLDLLVERGYLSRQRLLAALRLQTVRHLEDLLHWQQGDFKFYGGDEVSYEDGFEPISVEDLLLRHLDDFAGPASPPAAAAGPRPLAAAAPAIPTSSSSQAPAAPALRPAGRSDPPMPPPPPVLTPPAPPPAAASGGIGALGARIVPGPGAAGTAAAGDRLPADWARPDSGELWMPELPDLPEAPGSPAPRSEATPAAAAVESLGEAPALSLPGAATAGSAATAAAVSAAAAAVPTASVPTASVPAASIPAASVRAAFAPAATAAAPSPQAGGSAAVPPPSAEAAGPLPWPAAVMSPPPSSPPARPRPTGARVLKRTGLPSAASAGAASAAAATGAAALSPPAAGGTPGSLAAAPLVPPDHAAAAARARSTATSAMAVAPAPARAAAAPARRGAQTAPAEVAALDSDPGPSLSKHFRQMRVERLDRGVPVSHRLAAAGLAAAAAVSLAVAVWRAPQSALLPFPWQQEERAAFVRNQRESLFDKIDGAAKAAFLREGRFPDQLVQLRDAGLLSPADLDDPLGEPLRYAAREDSYTLQATASGKQLADADTSGSIAGNFLLDPSLLQGSVASGPPIVLLD